MNYYQQVMQQSIEALSSLIRERRKLDKRIARLKKMVGWAALQASQNLADSEAASDNLPRPLGSLGFTDAVRRVLSTYQIWLSPVLVRDLLPTVGFDTDRHKEPLPSIHVILGRLVSSGEALESQPAPGNHVYIWAERANAAALLNGA